MAWSTTGSIGKLGAAARMLVNTAGKNRGVPGCGSAPASPMARADMF